MYQNRTATRVGGFVLTLRALAEHRANQKHRRFWVRHVRAGSDESYVPSEAAVENPDVDNHEATEGDAQSAGKSVEKLEGMVEDSRKLLMKATAVFPFDMFPDSIIIDRKKITIVHRAFFSVQQTVSVRHSDLRNVQADLGPFLASLTITSEQFVNNTQTIRYLTRHDALAIQRIIQGMIIAHNEGVDLNGVGDEKLLELLNELGNSESAGRTPLT